MGGEYEVGSRMRENKVQKKGCQGTRSNSMALMDFKRACAIRF